MKKADGIVFDTIGLPLANIQYMKYGKGAPLIIFPATISRLENWTNILKFMGQKYSAYFFELPGHGKSSKFSKPFKSNCSVGKFFEKKIYFKFVAQALVGSNTAGK